MRTFAMVLLAVAAFGSTSGQASYVCTDERGKISIQDQPCAAKKASTTNLPVKADALSDRNSLETVNRFYRAMSERDPEAASRFLADAFVSEVRRPAMQTAKDDKASLSAQLREVLSAVKSYAAKTDCRVANRSAVAYSLSCRVEEEGALGAQVLRTVSDQVVTVVLDGGFVKLGKIVADERDVDAQVAAERKRN